MTGPLTHEMLRTWAISRHLDHRADKRCLEVGLALEPDTGWRPKMVVSVDRSRHKVRIRTSSNARFPATMQLQLLQLAFQHHDHSRLAADDG